jgi:thymidylate synthase (FAD)
MILVKPSFTILEIMGSWGGITPLQWIEIAGRTCYKSEAKLTKESAQNFVLMLLNKGHETPIEHSAMMVKFIIDRGVSHELVRHRLCAFSQESTRYVNYKGGCTFIIPPWVSLKEGSYDGNIPGYEVSDNRASLIWYCSMLNAEQDYIKLLDNGWTPQQARSVLPNSTKTEIVVTANFREWRHIFKLRTSKAAHPQMREIMNPLLKEVQEKIPVIFDDINH